MVSRLGGPKHQEKFDTIELSDFDDDGFDYYITPAPKFGKQFKTIKIKSTSYDEGEGHAPVTLFEVESLGVDAWDIINGKWDESRHMFEYEIDFANEILEKFYKLVESNDPKVQEYIIKE